jgi:predicted lactoylglutathione lyase
MPKQNFVNLPVNDLKKSMDFFTQLGFTFNLQFTDEKAACLIINEGSIYAMLLTEPMFKNFTNKEIADARKTTETILALDVDTKEEVDELVKKAVKAGGSVYADPQDHGWMYQHGFEDPDGLQWELLYMDDSKIPKG